MLALLLESAVRSMALGAAVWIVLRVFRIRTPQSRSTAWTAVLLSAVTMPLLMQATEGMIAKAPPSTVEWLRAEASPLVLRPLTPAASLQSASSIASSMDWVILASIVYLLVAAAWCLRVLVGLVQSHHLWKAAVPLKEPWASGCDVRVSAELTIPVTFGSTILLPPDWPQWSTFKRNAVFLHEKSHVRRRDFYVHLLAGLHRSVFWFSPLAWWLQNHLLELAETNCDDEAIRTVEDRVSYAEILVELAGKGSRSGFVGVAMARGKTVELRVERILRGAAIAPKASLLRCLLIVALLVPLAGLAAGIWHVQAQAVPLALTLPQPTASAQQPIQVPAQPVPAAAQQPASPVQAVPPAAQQRARPVQAVPPAAQQPARLVQPAPAAIQQPASPVQPTGQYLARWIEQDVPYIASAEEQNAFQRLTSDEEREQFIASFWMRRDSTPRTADNEFRDEYYRRIAAANQRFTTPSGIRGWLTDRGRVLIMYGEPDATVTAMSASLRREDGAVISTGPLELWRYRYIQGIGDNVELTFVDTARDGNYHLVLDPRQKDLIIKIVP